MGRPAGRQNRHLPAAGGSRSLRLGQRHLQKSINEFDLDWSAWVADGFDQRDAGRPLPTETQRLVPDPGFSRPYGADHSTGFDALGLPNPIYPKTPARLLEHTKGKPTAIVDEELARTLGISTGDPNQPLTAFFAGGGRRQAATMTPWVLVMATEALVPNSYFLCSLPLATQ